MLRTHLAIGVFLLLMFLPQSNHKLVFFIVVLIASAIPDVDSGFSKVGKNWIFKILRWFTKHRGVIHSFSFCIVISFLFWAFYPPAAFPFFLGYGIHLLIDSFSVDGISPFWPLEAKLNGKLTTGGKAEYILFVFFVVLDVVVLISWFI